MDRVNFEGFRSHKLQKQKQTQRGPVYGGLAVLVKDELRQGIRFLQSMSSE